MKVKNKCVVSDNEFCESEVKLPKQKISGEKCKLHANCEIYGIDIKNLFVINIYGQNIWQLDYRHKFKR